ncbi:MAG: hypothetical protein UX20_C0014G0008 [Candidatus Magasanikbacteria bacterium GW2011_GWC2_45_8]|uniref:Polysaccharide chain length determinant N-terminal domain-containing protein n=1 Tax=Candidatus Magasanikbacteria bacterium GW2011_GWC2_45_8 TaxID=1619050 RepID=A0A0G1MZT9_9BACT|nr:MAG: hypothetical protein UX20_C0014G0008 [Candidatus Magasanikbacteria bacterium GW2011_GWC2_45_8]HBW73738.1 hypothetical protein [Candidatus Magasanikbacteria bacterium]
MAYTSLLFHHKGSIIKAAIVGALIAVLVSVFLPQEYAATTKLLVIPKVNLGVDPYTAVKSGERINQTLSEVIRTTSFFDKVMSASGFQIDQSPYQTTEQKKRKRWERAVSPTVLSGTSLLSVTAFDTDQKQAEVLAGAVAFVLQTRGTEYTGADVEIKVVDTPVLSRFPVRPNYVLNLIFGALVFGLIAAGNLVWKSEN